MFKIQQNPLFYKRTSKNALELGPYYNNNNNNNSGGFAIRYPTNNALFSQQLYPVQEQLCELGQVEWFTKIGGVGTDEVPNNMSVTNDGSVYISGYSNNTGYIDIYDAEGTTGPTVSYQMSGDPGSDNYIVKFC